MPQVLLYRLLMVSWPVYTPTMTVPGIIFRMWFEINVLFVSLMPMTMETRCSNVFFQKYSKKKSAEDTLVPPLWEHAEKMFVFLGLFVHSAVRGGTCVGKFKTARDSFFGVKLRGRSLRKNQETHTLIWSFFYFRVRQRYASNVFAAASICAIIYSKSTLISELIFALDALSHCEQ